MYHLNLANKTDQVLIVICIIYLHVPKPFVEWQHFQLQLYNNNVTNVQITVYHTSGRSVRHVG